MVILKIICITLDALVCAYIAFYNYCKCNYTESISEYISLAQERTDLTGPQKMDLVISWLRYFSPRFIKIVFNDKVLRMMAQNIYNDMKRYRDSYIAQNCNIVLKEKEETK